jgi:hypothetical protein
LAALREANHQDIELYEYGLTLFNERYRQMQAEQANGHRPAIAPAQRHTSLWTDFTQVDVGTNWHPGEHKPGKGYLRWTGPGTHAFLTLPPLIERTNFIVRFRVFQAVVPEILDTLQLHVNNRRIELTSRLDGARDQRIFEGMIPYQVTEGELGHVTRLKFSVEKTLRMSDVVTNSVDERRLGIQLQWLHIYPM